MLSRQPMQERQVAQAAAQMIFGFRVRFALQGGAETERQLRKQIILQQDVQVHSSDA